MTTKRRYKILEADVEFISLCPRGKNGIATLYKEDDDRVEIVSLVKDDNIEKGELTSIVYAPGMYDKDGDVADKEAIATMCKSFMKRGAQVDIRHNEIPLSKEDVYVTECFLAKGSDPEFQGIKDKDGNSIDMDGAWITRFQIENEKLRKEYREGKWDGVSLFSKKARVEPILDKEDNSTDAILDALASRLRATPNQEPEDEIEMKKEELVEVLSENNKSLVSALAKAIKGDDGDGGETKPPVTTKPVAKSDDAEVKGPEFEGDRANPDDVKKHLRKVKMHNLQKEVDWNDPASVEEYQTKLAKAVEGEGDDGNKGDDDGKPGDSEEVRRLRAALRKAEGASNQGGGGKSKGEGKYAHLSKEDAEIAENADKVADWINGSSED